MTTREPLDVLLVTGMSGATVDNIPSTLIVDVIETLGHQAGVKKVAISVDVRGGSQFDELKVALAQIKEHGYPLRIVFLEAGDEPIVRRYESSRRPHPLQREHHLLEAVAVERGLLGSLRAKADLVIDTSNLNVHDLRRAIENAFGDESSMTLRVSILSFGFKYGIPVDADLVADMRFLPNPFWNEALREHSGKDQDVSANVLGQPETEKFLTNYTELIEMVREGYLREGKRFVTVAIGCTGGKHRSVAVAEELARRLNVASIETRVVHRDLGRE
ncbi:MAG: RNase adapter RapZ [Actinobacteria bacterium]|nr:RNase adapter RapZ [Actinomycetota bacterium]